jgi:hypothetical protein
LFCGFDEGVGASGTDFNWFFCQDVQAVTRGGDALRGVEAGGTADDDEIHGAMLQESVEVLIGSAAVFAAEASDFFGVGSLDRGNFDSGDGTGGAGVGFRNVAAADEADVGSHEEFLVVSFWF